MISHSFSSDNLIKWKYHHEFVENDLFSLVGDDGACPYFWPIGHKHMLLFYSHMSGGQYLIGDYDTSRDKLKVISGGKFNFGASNPCGLHAPSATPDDQGNIIVMFNMNPGMPKKGWNQIMSLPRKLQLKENDVLKIVRDSMESVSKTQHHTFSIPLEVSISSGNNWGDAN